MSRARATFVLTDTGHARAGACSVSGGQIDLVDLVYLE